MRKFEAHYFKRDRTYYGSVLEFGKDACVSGRTLAEVRAKLRAVLPEAIEKARRNKIRGKSVIVETISL